MAEPQSPFKPPRAVVPPDPGVITALVYDHDAADQAHVAQILARRRGSSFNLFVSRPLGPVADQGRDHVETC